jgi:hypothetical protein
MTAKHSDTFLNLNRRISAKQRRTRANDRSVSSLFADSERQEEQPKPRFDIDAVPSEEDKQDRALSPMRVLLQNAKTGRFFTGGLRWTPDPKQARNFHTGWWATVFAFTMNPRNLIIHYEFSNDRYNLDIPVLAARVIEPA